MKRPIRFIIPALVIVLLVLGPQAAADTKAQPLCPKRLSSTGDSMTRLRRGEPAANRGSWANGYHGFGSGFGGSPTSTATTAHHEGLRELGAPTTWRPGGGRHVRLPGPGLTAASRRAT
jgi:hypothetical protein